MRILCAVVLTVAASTVGAEEIQQAAGRRNCPPPLTCPPVVPVGPDGQPLPQGQPGTLPPVGQPGNPNAAPATDAFAQAGEGARGAALASGQTAMPGFFGDMIGISGTRFVTINTGGGPAAVVLRVPSANHGSGFKVADGESPAPQDRISYDFNAYNGVARDSNAGSGQVFQVFRHVIGIEKTLFNGNASIGLRLPFVSVTGVPGLEDREFADMSVIAKYAFINEPQCGRVYSAGIIVTVPTGRGTTVDLPNPNNRNLIDGTFQTTIYDTYIQPFIGGAQALTPRLYVQGFASVAAPTDGRDVTVLTSSFGVGYWLYRNANDRFVEGVVPTFEVHTNTPLNKGPDSIPISFTEQVNLTSGVYVLLPRSTAGFAVGVPTIGPRPYTVEYAVNYTFKF